MPEEKKKKIDEDKEEVPQDEPEKSTPAKKKSKRKEYMPKFKPELSPEEKHAMNLRREKKRKTPHFRRQEWFRYKRLGDEWRKPRGLHSKARRNYLYRQPVVSKGFGGPNAVKGRHPSGFQEVMVYNHRDLEGLDPKTQAVRIGHSVGYLKRMYIALQADEMDMRILNFNRQTHEDLVEEARKRGIELPSKKEGGK